MFRLRAELAADLLALFYNICHSSINLLVPLLLIHQGESLLTMGLLTAIPAGLQIFMRIPAGWLADRWGERQVLFIAFLAVTVSGPLYLLSPAATWVFVAQVLSGLSRSTYWPPLQAYVTRLSTGAPQVIMGRFYTMVSLGMIIGPLIMGYVIRWFGFNGAFTVFTVFGLLCVLINLFMPGLDRRQAAAQEDRGDWRLLLTNRPLWWAVLYIFGAAVPMALMASFFPWYVTHVGLSDTTAGVLSSVRGLLLTLSSLLLGSRLTRKTGAGVSFLLMLSVALGVGLMPVFTSAAGLGFAVALTAIGGALLQVLHMLLIGRHTPDQWRATAMAFAGAFWSFGQTITPIVLGLLAEAGHVEAGFIGAGALLLAAAFFTWLRFDPRRFQPRAQQPPVSADLA